MNRVAWRGRVLFNSSGLNAFCVSREGRVFFFFFFFFAPHNYDINDSARCR